MGVRTFLVLVAVLFFLGGCFGSEDVYLDTSTRLMWQAKGKGNFNNWEARGEYTRANNRKKVSVCGDMEYAGHNDWRLPSLEELVTISDMSNSPKVKAGIRLKPTNYWSTTRFGGATSWTFDFGSGTRKDMSNSAEIAVVCVRDNKKEEG